MNANERHRRAMEIFDEVCDLSADQRGAILSQRCEGDQALRDRVDSLLAQDGADDPFVSAAESGQIIAEFVSDHDAFIEGGDAIPERIGPYKIIRKIGAGGMGIIYEAEQESPRRRVALKVLRPGMVDRGMLKRFQHEAHVLGQLQHPGIAHIHEAGIADLPQGRQPFFVMEYIVGEPLDNHAKAQQLDVPQRLELLARVCDAVQHAHQKGIIHRDLKPSNVLVERNEDQSSRGTKHTSLTGSVSDSIGQPKVLDFGIARVTDADMQTVTLQTEVGQLVGTLAYMGPEQVAGNSDDLDTRCDVYALGVMLYELLLGKRPLNLTGLHMTEAARVIREQEPVRVGAIDKRLRGDIDTIVAKAMEKDRERRYVSAAEFAADIRRYLADEPIDARPASTFYQLSKFARRNKGLVGGLAATFVMLLVGLVGTSYGLIKAEQRRVEADEARQVAEQRERQVQSVADFQATILSGLDPMVLGQEIVSGMREEIESGMHELDLDADRIAGDLAQFDQIAQAANPTNVALQTLYDGILSPAKEAIGTAFADQPIVQAKLYHSVGTACTSLGRPDVGAELLRSALGLFQEELGQEHEDTLAVMRDLAVATADNAPQDGLTLLEKTVTGMTRVYGPEHERTLAVRAERGRIQRDLGRLDEADKTLNAALADAQSNLAENHAITANIFEYLGGLERRRDHPEAAEEYFRRALGINEQTAPHGEGTIRGHNNLGDLLRETGQFEEAEKHLRLAYEALRKLKGDEHPNTLIILSNLGGFLASRGRLDEAREIAENVLSTQERVLGANHPDTLRSRQNLAGICFRTGDSHQALAHLSSVLAGRREVMGEGHPSTLRTMRTIGAVLRMTGDLPGSEAMLREFCITGSEHLANDHPLLDDGRASLIVTLQLLGKWKASESFCRQSIEARRSARELNKVALASALRFLGAAMVFQDQFDAAEAILSEGVELLTESGKVDDWLGHESKSLQGMVLAGQSHFEEAEPILLTALEGLQQQFASADPVRRQWWIDIVRQRIEMMYEQWDQPSQLEKWRESQSAQP